MEKGEKMPRLIDKRCAIKHLKELLKNNIMPTEWYEGAKSAITRLQKEPTVDAEPVRHGHWEVIDEAEPRRYGCSNCKRLSFTEDNYCSYCGAKMDEVGEDD